MLTISKEQMAKAEEKYRIRFYKRIRAYVREKMPKETSSYPDSKLLAYIAEQDKIAEKHGIRTDQGVTKWVCLSLGYGKDFYRQADIKDYFSTPGKPGAEIRLSILMDHLNAKQKNPNAKIESIFAEHGYHIVEG